MAEDDKPPFGENQLKISAFTFAGLAMMLNIRLVYSAAPYALLRFKLPENLFSVFVRVMAGSLELWCLPSMTIANVMDFARKANSKEWYDWEYHYQSIFWSWANFFTFVILWISFIIGADQGNVTAFYWVIAASGFVFGINMVMVYAMEFQYLPWYMIGENSFPMVTSLMHYTGTLIFGNRRKWNSDYIIVTIDIVISLAISLVAAVLWTYAYYRGEDAKDGWGASDYNQRVCTKLGVSGTATELTYSIDPNYGPDSHAEGKCGHKKSSIYYLHFIPPSLMVLIGMGLVYTIYPAIAPGMIVPFYLIDKIEMVLLIATAFPPVIIGIMKNYDINPYIPMGNWGTYHQKSCKGGNKPEPGQGTTEQCKCGNGNSSSNSATLYLHNTTINSTDGFTGIATITATTNGAIDKITDTTLRKKAGGTMTKETPLHVGEILTLTGQPATPGSGDEVQINGTIIVTNPGTLGKTITLTGRLAGELTLANGDDNTNITVTLGGDSLTVNPDLTLEGVNITVDSSNLTGTASIVITTTNDTDDLTNMDENVTINVTKLTKAGGQLTTKTPLANGDTLILVGTATDGNIRDLKFTGTITIGGTGNGNLSSGLQFSGDVTNTESLQFQDADDGDGVTVKNSGTSTLTLPPGKLNALQNTNFSLTSPDTPGKHPLIYELVTKNTINIGTSTSGTNVKLSELSLIPVCITGTGSNAGFKATANLSLTRTETSATALKTTAGLNINLTAIASSNLNNANVTISKGEKDKVKSLPAGADLLKTETTLVPGDTLTLTITGGSSETTLTGKITVTSPGNLTGNLNLSGGLTASIVNLVGSGDGTLTATGSVNITNPKYDPMEFHVNHQSDHCCYWGAKVFKWSNTNHKTVWWHIPVVLGPFQICLAATFIYSLHYRDSNISRSIVNQPKMSTALSIIFYMCHEIQLALGFPGIASDDNILLPMQLVGAFLMVLLAFYSVGYITEYKRNDPLNWPTEGMTTWNSLCYWLKMASKITNKNFKQLFTTDLRRDLLLCIQKNELI